MKFPMLLSSKAVESSCDPGKIGLPGWKGPRARANFTRNPRVTFAWKYLWFIAKVTRVHAVLRLLAVCLRDRFQWEFELHSKGEKHTAAELALYIYRRSMVGSYGVSARSNQLKPVGASRTECIIYRWNRIVESTRANGWTLAANRHLYYY